MTNEQKAALVASLTTEEVALVKDIAATTDEEHALWWIEQRRRLAQCEGQDFITVLTARAAEDA